MARKQGAEVLNFEEEDPTKVSSSSLEESAWTG
jgi:hypothetical protein